MSTTPRLALGELSSAQSQKHVTVNEALIKIDALVNCRFVSMALTAPPDSPADGAAYLVGASATGAWSGYDGKIAYCIDGAWHFYAPFDGLVAYNAADGGTYVYSGAVWLSFPTQSIVVGFVVNDGSAGTGVGPVLLAPRAATISRCVVAVKKSASGTALTFDVTKNGTSIFSEAQTVAAGTEADTVATFSLSSGQISVAKDDKFKLNITSGSSDWAFTLQVE